MFIFWHTYCDGDDFMSGYTSGVQTTIRKSHLEEIRIRCMDHKCSLVI